MSYIFDQMNEWGKERLPFFFLIDFECKKPLILPLHAIDNKDIRYQISDGFLNLSNSFPASTSIIKELKVEPLSLEKYTLAFEHVYANLHFGNSFLTNLTGESKVQLHVPLEALFDQISAKYKLWVKNEFLCFSPEAFVQISKSGCIKSFPMKGTIDASIPDAESLLLQDGKEMFEHTTIVDLIRNDLSRVCTKVDVKRFRYTEKITKSDGRELIQVSSEINGQLPQNWQDNLGDIFKHLLPAGSISGAPKQKTLEIIKEAEGHTFLHAERGYYTGIFGIYTGKELSSSVLIRFIEERNGEHFYKSGGGITSRSILEKEYEELLKKIYVPLS